MAYDLEIFDDNSRLVDNVDLKDALLNIFCGEVKNDIVNHSEEELNKAINTLSQANEEELKEKYKDYL